MECIILIGIQASGKSTFYKEKFLNTHVRLNMDMLKTRHRENILLNACLEAKQPYVVDNTNPSIEDRKKYIELAKAHKFSVIGYFFEPDYAVSAQRNEMRLGKEKVPEIGIKSVLKKLEVPELDEGFDKLFRVATELGQFHIQKME